MNVEPEWWPKGTEAPSLRGLLTTLVADVAILADEASKSTAIPSDADGLKAMADQWIIIHWRLLNMPAWIKVL